MTPANPGALVEALVEALTETIHQSLHSGGNYQMARAGQSPGWMASDSLAYALIAGPLAPLLAAKEAAEARVAQLQGEVEAKDRARWLPIATAPTDRPVVVRMKTGFLPAGWFVATVTLPDPDDESRLAGCSTILNYDGQPLLTRFYGGWTEWLDDGGSDHAALAARAATAREGQADA